MATDAWDSEVIGQMKDNAHQLLVMDGEGRCLAYDMVEEKLPRSNRDDTWLMDICRPNPPRPDMVTEAMTL